MTGTDIAVIIGALIPVGGGIRWLWTEYRKTRASEIEKAIEAAVQTERADQYRIASEATITAKNAELEAERAKTQQAEAGRQRLEESLDRLSKAYEKLVERLPA